MTQDNTLSPAPYQCTPVFDQDTLPEALRREHSTKAGTWGLLVVRSGAARLVFHAPARDVHVTPGAPAVIPPQAVHHVEVDGLVRLHVEFYREEPGSVLLFTNPDLDRDEERLG